ncbi:MAG: hypothetical protein ABIX46_04755 [Burkholderiaceae bacterium]
MTDPNTDRPSADPAPQDGDRDAAAATGNAPRPGLETGVGDGADDASSTGEEDPGAALDDPAMRRAMRGEPPGSAASGADTGAGDSGSSNDTGRGGGGVDPGRAAGADRGSTGDRGLEAQRLAALDRIRQSDNDSFGDADGSVDEGRG